MVSGNPQSYLAKFNKKGEGVRLEEVMEGVRPEKTAVKFSRLNAESRLGVVLLSTVVQPRYPKFFTSITHHLAYHWRNA